MTYNLKKAMIIALILLVAVVSVTVVAPWASSSKTHAGSIEQTENMTGDVLTLSGISAGTSATLSLLPGDICTPIAEQMAELSKYFLIVLSALYLEKYLITIAGIITFYFLIPLACILFCIYILTDGKKWREVAGKLALIGLIIFILVPVSSKLSALVYQSQQGRINNAIEEYNDLEIEDDKGGGIISELTTITNKTVDSVTNFLSSLVESLAVMIVASCLIPILVFVLLAWIVKTIFAGT
ncbi:MAG: hypothetical protein E7307_03680 [Butyrivibrio sp.]|nr:hypothetical protein [Butyrivibrio sp.]